MRALVILALFAAPALADSADCEALRRTLSLAARNNVDVGGLRQLEPQVCGTSLKPTRTTCEQLSEFWMLAMALKQPGELISALEAQRGVWCQRDAEPVRPLEWPEGGVLRSTTGTLSWPNGVIARSATGSWWSPEGVIIRSSSLTLSYPSGPGALVVGPVELAVGRAGRRGTHRQPRVRERSAVVSIFPRRSEPRDGRITRLRDAGPGRPRRPRVMNQPLPANSGERSVRSTG